MNISMDKYKTSRLGQALKKVYHGEMTIDESVKMAENEIRQVFETDKNAGSGFYGDVIGKCPKCGRNVARGRYSYACEDFPDKCDFKINLRILGCPVPKEQAAKLLTNGKTDKMNFTSLKTGKVFSSSLKLDENKKVVFDFT